MSERVPVVDDEPAMRRSLERSLRAKGYEVHLAGDADSAYSILQEVTVDAALLDLRMPHLAGDALAVALLHRWPYLSGRIILISGDPFAERETWPAELRSCPVLGRPFNLDTLHQTVGALISGVAATAQPRKRHGPR